MKKALKLLMCVLVAQLLIGQQGEPKKENTGSIAPQKSTAKASLFKIKKSTLSNSNFIGPGKFNPTYPNFYTYWDNKVWPIEATSIRYMPSSNLTVPTKNKNMSIEVSGKTEIPGQILINIGPPVYETADLRFYEKLFRESKEYIIIFNFKGRGHIRYYHKSLVTDYFK